MPSVKNQNPFGTNTHLPHNSDLYLICAHAIVSIRAVLMFKRACAELDLTQLSSDDEDQEINPTDLF